MNKILIICEKPLQAQDFVKVFSKYNNSTFTKHDGYSTDGKYIISNAIGHLIELAPPSAYNEKFKNWSIDDLPIIPDNFKLLVTKEKQKQFSILEKLINTSNIIYNATDPAREGELIFRYILKKTNVNENSKTIKRIWANDPTEETIIKAFENAADQKKYENLFLSAKARSESDWLIGLNATRALTLVAKANTTLTLGRIQTAILRLIVDRYFKNVNFKSEKLFTPVIYNSDNNLEFTFNTQFKNELEAKNILQKTKDKYIPEIINETKKAKQPILFALSDLQILANEKFNFSAAKTLDVAQSLYENKLISYPRTDSNYLNNSLTNDVKRILKEVQNLHLNRYNSEISSSNDFLEKIDNHFIFNDKKTSDHYGIMPLQHNLETYEKLTNDQKNLYDEIIKRFMQCFMKEMIYNDNKIIIKITEEDYYYNNNRNIIYNGFNLLNEKENNEKNVPQLTSNKEMIIDKKIIKTGATTPLKLFTESTLLAAMKNPTAHENITENKNEIKSLGTSATFHTYLPILIKRKYVIFQKKYIIPTKLGSSIIENLKDSKLNSIELTANIEFQLKNIENGTLPYEKYMKAIKAYTLETTEHIKKIGAKVGINVEATNGNLNLKCPSCSDGKLYLATSKKNYYCNKYKEENPCNFILYTTIAGKKLTESNIKDLITKKETNTISFTNKNKIKYKAKIILNKEFKTELNFENNTNKK